MDAKPPMTLGVIVGNRGFFPDHLARSGREEMLAVLAKAGVNAIAADPGETKHGAVETRVEARICADLFRRHRNEIAGVIVTLPNFGDERGLADTLRMADLGVPVLVQATPDTPGLMQVQDRRDSFCGKMSACNNLKQYGIRYSLTSCHTEAPSSPEFARDLDWFLGVCRVVKGLRRLRIGAIGARPAAFNTVRFSEKLLEASGISIEPIDLSEIVGRVGRLEETHPAVQAKLSAIRAYVSTIGVPPAALVKMAKLGAVIDDWMQQTDVAVSAVQCWTSLEEFFGVVPCTIMSLMSDQLKSSACEVDVCGVIGMHAHAPRVGHAERPSRLEQQLRRRSRQGRLLPLQQPPEALLRGGAHGLPGDHRRHRRCREHLRHLRRPGEGRSDVVRPLLDRRRAGSDSAGTWVRANSRETRWRRSAARASCASRTCRTCSASSARTGSSTTSRQVSPQSPRSFTRRRRSTWGGTCTGTSSATAQEHACVAGFGLQDSGFGKQRGPLNPDS